MIIKKDIIILVIASTTDTTGSSGKRYINFINNYWSKIIKYIKRHKYSIKVYLLFGNDAKLDDLDITDDDILILNTEDSLVPGILNKTIDSLKIINNMYSYKHIIRTNLSSFFIIDSLIKISEQLKDTNIYDGIRPRTRRVSGAGIWLSRDIVNYIIENESFLLRHYCDDDAIYNLLFLPYPLYSTVCSNIPVDSCPPPPYAMIDQLPTHNIRRCDIVTTDTDINTYTPYKYIIPIIIENEHEQSAFRIQMWWSRICGTYSSKMKVRTQQQIYKEKAGAIIIENKQFDNLLKNLIEEGHYHIRIKSGCEDIDNYIAQTFTDILYS
mgnify:FL=1|tara:strand:+ start:1205 stop:2179 length:975 start_codon:yes stop_codon:yes gene_type:complete